MKPSFNYIVHYTVNAECVSPLRTGNTDNDTESILRTVDGQPFIQAPSLAGAFRDWVHNNRRELEIPLFGSQNSSGSLTVSDGMFRIDSLQEERPHVRISSRSGTVMNGAKYETVHLAKGSRFNFTLTLFTTEYPKEEMLCMEQVLGALHIGQITLGAKKSTGYGRVTLRVYRSCLDMRKTEDRMVWLSGEISGNEIRLPDSIPSDKVVFTFTGHTTGLLVKSNFAEEHTLEKRSTRSVTVNLKEGKDRQAVLPGSSIKGAVRNQAKQIAASLQLSEELIDLVFGSDPDKTQEHQASAAIFTDALLKNAKAVETHRIRIDRFTGGVIPKALFNEEPLGANVSFTISLPKSEEAGCGLLLYALRDLAAGLYSLGSGSSIGRGSFSDAEIRTGSLELKFASDGTVRLIDSEKLADRWAAAMEVYHYAE